MHLLVTNNKTTALVASLLYILLAASNSIANKLLSADSLTVSDKWSHLGKETIIGKPVERTILVQTTNSNSADIPDIQFVTQQGLDIIHKIEAGNNYKKFKFTYTPKEEGLLLIEDIDLRWYNNNTKTFETTVIAGHVFFVVAEGESRGQEEQLLLEQEVIRGQLSWKQLILYPESPVFPFNILIILGLFSWLLPGAYTLVIKKLAEKNQRQSADRDKPGTKNPDKQNTASNQEDHELSDMDFSKTENADKGEVDISIDRKTSGSENNNMELPDFELEKEATKKAEKHTIDRYRPKTLPNRKKVYSSIRTMKRSCANGNLELVKTVLLRWGEEIWKDNPPATVLDIHKRLGEDEELTEILTKLHNIKSTDTKKSVEPSFCDQLVTIITKYSDEFLR